MKKKKELNTQCRKLLVYIFEYKQRNDFSPDVREMCLAIQGKQEQPISTSVANYYLDILEEEGLISFLYLATRRKDNHVYRPSKTLHTTHRAARTVHLTDKGNTYVNDLLKSKSGLPIDYEFAKDYEFALKRITTVFQVPVSKLTPAK